MLEMKHSSTTDIVTSLFGCQQASTRHQSKHLKRVLLVWLACLLACWQEEITALVPYQKQP
jgi:hypothetical protein